MLKNLTTKEKIIVLLIVIFTLLRIILFNINSNYSWDEAVHLDLAEGLHSGQSYGVIGSINTDNYRAPIFPITIYLTYLFTGVNEISAKLLVVLISVATIGLVFYVTNKMFDKKFALLTTLFVATNHLHIFFTYRIMAEILATALLLLGFYFVYLTKKNLKFLPLLGIIFAIIILTKYTLVLFEIALVISLAICDRKFLSQIIKSKYFYVGILFFILTISPWLFYRMSSHGELVPSSYYTSSFSLSHLQYLHVYFILFLAVAGFTAPFAIYGFYKIFKEKRNLLILALALALLIFFGLEGLTTISLRYIIEVLPFLGMISVYGILSLKNKFVNLFVILCLLNAIVGYFITLQFVYPSTGFNNLPDFVNVGTSFNENMARKNTSLFLKNATSENETIMTDYYALVWIYTHRNWVPVPETEQAFWNVVNKLNVNYVFTEPNSPPYLQNNSKVEVLEKTDFTELYQIRR